VPLPADPDLRRRSRLVLVLCLLVSLILLALPTATKIAVADGLASVLLAPYTGTVDFLDAVAAAHRRNLALQSEVAALRLDAAACERLRRQRDELAAALGLVTAAPARLVPCEVQERRLSPEATLVRITSPEPVAWERFQPVVTAAGLFGRVRQATSPAAAWVELLTSPGSAVSCEIVRTGLTGILEYRDRRFRLTMVGRDEDVRPGDRLVTSRIVASLPGLGLATPRWPAGIPVGTVVSVRESEDPLFLEITVEPAASFTRPGLVFVVTGAGDWYEVAPAAGEGGAP